MEQSRKNKYCNKVLGEFEAATWCAMEEWEDKQFDEAFELLGAVENELKAARSDWESEKESKVKERACILCGKMTKGSVGRAGIKWAMICQECKDKADNDLLNSMRPIATVMDMYNELQRWLKGGEDK
jgi:protein-arginine kinase activator protein McsA